jgi:serine/threonine protein kinase
MSFIGKTIHGYDIKSEIGRGGMAVVYLGENVILSKEIAIKVIHRQFSHDEDQRKRFQREAVMQSRLSHPKLIKLINYFEQDDDSFILMEYFKSRALSTVIGKEIGPVPFESKAKFIFKQILDGIGYAHEKNLIHRDIKPSNILINSKDEIKVTDFGIAKPASGEEDLNLTGQGTIVGTPYYMSPEQIKGLAVDHRSDIYSLGITFYETLTGRLPFEHKTDFDIRQAQVNEQPPDPKSFYPHIPEHVVSTIMKSLRKNPKDRQQSCSEFLDQLEGKSKITSPKRTFKKAPAKSSTIPKNNKARNKDKSSSSKMLWLVASVFVFLFVIANIRDSEPRYTKDTSKGSGSSKSKISAKTYYENGVELYKKNEFWEAISQFKLCLAKNEDYHDARRYCVLAFEIVEDYKSMLYYANILKSKQGTSYDYYLGGLSNYRSRNYDSAINDYNQSMQMGNDSYYCYNGLAWSYYAKNIYNESLKNFSYAIDIGKKENGEETIVSEAYRGRSQCYYNLNELKKAFSDMSNAIKRDKNNGWLYSLRGQISSGMRKNKQACKDYKKACDLGYEKACSSYRDCD